MTERLEYRIIDIYFIEETPLGMGTSRILLSDKSKEYIQEKADGILYSDMLTGRRDRAIRVTEARIFEPIT